MMTKKKLDEIKASIKAEFEKLMKDHVPKSYAEALERRVTELEKQNKQLFDTLMSRNWEEYAQLREDQTYTVPETELEADQDYTNAGEIVDGR